MASRPAYYVKNERVVKRDFTFQWFSGLAVSQKQKSVAAFHEAIKSADSAAVPLEISTKGTDPLGVSMSAFNLRLDGYPLENVFQSSKVFIGGGPYRDLLDVHPKEAKRDERLKTSGRLVGFNYGGSDFPLFPKTVFYDYIYIRAAAQSVPEDEIQKLAGYNYFTDIEFNPEKSINTQAKTAAIIRLMLDMYGTIPPIDNISEFIAFHRSFVIA